MADGFDAALRVVNPSTADTTNAMAAHAEVRVFLETDAQMRAWGVDSLLIGSYARQVSIHRIKDVDVFCKLMGIEASVPARTVLNHVYKLLASKYGYDAVELQARSVKVAIPRWNGLHVDAVPARPSGTVWEIPDRSEDGGWQETNPERLSELSSRMNEAMSLLYVPTVKLLRQTRRAATIDKPGGLYVETALYQACLRDEVSTDSQRHAYVTGSRAIANALSTREPIQDPTRPGEVYEFRATSEQWEDASRKFAGIAAEAARALAAPRCEAAAIFQRLLGKNSDGKTVYSIPGDCEGSDEPRAVVIPGDERLTSGDQRFAQDAT